MVVEEEDEEEEEGSAVLLYTYFILPRIKEVLFHFLSAVVSSLKARHLPHTPYFSPGTTWTCPSLLPTLSTTMMTLLVMMDGGGLAGRGEHLQGGPRAASPRKALSASTVVVSQAPRLPIGLTVIERHTLISHLSSLECNTAAAVP